MEIRLLGPLEVRIRGRAVEVAGRRLRLLVAVLALQAGQVVEAERLIDLLWEEASLPADPVNALQALVSRLRRALAVASGSEWLVSKPPGYLLAAEPDQVDVLRFERLAAAGHAALVAGRHREAAASLRAALDLWRGPALADFAGEPFAAANATRLNELRLGALEGRIEAELALGEHARLVGELEALAAEQPLRERVHALLMRALYGAGRQAEALAAYRRARQVLAERAGLDPSPELRGVEQAILAQDPSLSAPTPTPAPAAVPPTAPAARRGRTNLPAPLTSFVGREGEIAQVLGLLGRHRLVTLTGPGGVGKTRLAVECVRRMLGPEQGGDVDGGWLVEVAGLRDGRLLPLAVLDALGLAEERPRLDTLTSAASGDAEDRLLAALGHRRALLLLDNCEHLAEPVAELAERLLGACPGLRVLATSREALRVPGEARCPVPALPVPPPGPVSATDLAGFAGSRLFLERAATADPGFAVRGAADAAAVAEICRRLDGLPLAIELAAARVAALPPRELAARLDDRFRLLTAGARTALPRQQTLRAVIDWSWELLDRAERAALRRLAVFTGGCTLAAAEAVCAGPELPAVEVAATIARLVDKSLLAVGPGPPLAPLWWPGVEALGLPSPPAPASEPRYHLLDTVQAYVAERLAEAGETDPVARAHAEWCVSLAEAAAPGLRGAEQLTWLARLSAELGNLLAGLQWMLAHGEAGLAVRLVAVLGWFLFLLGQLEDAADALEQALALPGPVPGLARGQALYFLVITSIGRASGQDGSRALVEEARAALERGATSSAERAFTRVLTATAPLFAGASEEAEQLIEESLTEVEQAGGYPAAMIYQLRAFARARRGDLEGAREDAEVCLLRFRQLGERWGTVQALELLAAADMVAGSYGPATERIEEALRCAWGLRLVPEVGVQLCRLAHLAVLQGDLDRAEARLRQALAAAEEFGLATELGFVHAGLSLLAQRRGDPERARHEYEQAHALLHGHLIRHPLGTMAYRWLGIVAMQQGDLDRAAAMHRAILELARAQGFPAMFAPGLEGMAAVRVAEGDLEQAAVLLGAAAALRRPATAPPPDERMDVERASASACQGLGAERYAEVFARGEALSLEEAVALAEKA